MQRVTTLIVTVGSRFDVPARKVAESSGNVSYERGPDPIESLPEWAEALRSAWRASMRRSTIYTVLSADPLAPVVREWARRLDGDASELELAIGLLGDAPLPDFYLVDSQISGSAAHWYLDLLPGLAPSRVIVGEPTELMLTTTLRRLPYGRELPEAVIVLDASRTYVPVPRLESSALIH